MACERYRDALTDVAAGATAAADLEAHLASCAPCRHELQALRQALATVDGELASLRAAEPSRQLAARIRTALAEPARAEPTWRHEWTWTLTAAAATLLVALAVVKQRVSEPQPGAAVASVAVPAPRATAGIEAVAHPASPARVTHGSQTHPPGRPASEPEVLVPAGEAEALFRFAASLQRRSVTTESLLVADLGAPLSEPRGVEIRPLEIVPLDPEETSGAE